MVLLDSDVAGLGFGPCDLVLLLRHHSRKISTYVPNIVVTKHKRSAVMTTKSVVTKNVHLVPTTSPSATTDRWTRKRLVRSQGQLSTSPSLILCRKNLLKLRWEVWRLRKLMKGSC